MVHIRLHLFLPHQLHQPQIAVKIRFVRNPHRIALQSGEYSCWQSTAWRIYLCNQQQENILGNQQHGELDQNSRQHRGQLQSSKGQHCALKSDTGRNGKSQNRNNNRKKNTTRVVQVDFAVEPIWQIRVNTAASWRKADAASTVVFRFPTITSVTKTQERKHTTTTNKKHALQEEQLTKWPL